MSKLKNIVKVIVGIAFPPLGILMIMLWGMKKLSPEVRKKAMIGGSVLVALIAIIVVVTKPTQEELATEAGFATAQEYEDHMNKQKAIETARRKEQKDIEATKAADPMSGHLDKLEIKSTRIELLPGQRVDVKMVTFYSKNGVKSYLAMYEDGSIGEYWDINGITLDDDDRADVIELLTKQVSGLERMISKDYSALPIGECVEQGSKKYSKQVGFKVCNNKSGKYIVSWFTFGLQDTYFQYEADEIAQPKQYLANLQAATPPQNAYILLQEYHKQRSSVELF
ncbi:hypothetical protein [Photobacterium indicum]|uniref:Uncharacterized protein n=1 Tax=Photobacterium indicum TaxID=81447 RepID=A0A2T3LEM9_9GAMM|nr:hypothetical protein [Photobacterium indicum]PSV49832.1 hypothetical protein C9J47_04570 [Photobacterium indicum]